MSDVIDFILSKLKFSSHVDVDVSTKPGHLTLKVLENSKKCVDLEQF